MLRKISEEARWKEGDGRRFEAVRQVNAGGGSYGGCREPEAHAHRQQQGDCCHKWYVMHVRYSGILNMLNAHTLVRRKRDEASGPTIGKQHRRHKMFVIHSVVLPVVSLTCSQGKRASGNGYFPRIHR